MHVGKRSWCHGSLYQAWPWQIPSRVAIKWLSELDIEGQRIGWIIITLFLIFWQDSQSLLHVFWLLHLSLYYCCCTATSGEGGMRTFTRRDNSNVTWSLSGYHMSTTHQDVETNHGPLDGNFARLTWYIMWLVKQYGLKLLIPVRVSCLIVAFFLPTMRYHIHNSYLVLRGTLKNNWWNYVISYMYAACRYLTHYLHNTIFGKQ